MGQKIRCCRTRSTRKDATRQEKNVMGQKKDAEE